MTSVGGIFGKVATGIAVASGFFSSVFSPSSVLRTTAGAASGAARKKTATRYATVDLVMVRKVGARFAVHARKQWVRSPPPSPSSWARGQFPNNPCGWSHHQAEGIRTIRNMMILLCRGGTFPSPHIRGVGGLWVEIIHPPQLGRTNKVGADQPSQQPPKGI